VEYPVRLFDSQVIDFIQRFDTRHHARQPAPAPSNAGWRGAPGRWQADRLPRRRSQGNSLLRDLDVELSRTASLHPLQKFESPF
jgi:hypothetical protein